MTTFKMDLLCCYTTTYQHEPKGGGRGYAFVNATDNDDACYTIIVPPTLADILAQR